MGNSAIKAQKLANEANYHIANETNELNRAIAESQNELNYKMFNEQNDWNYKMWDEQNKYNDPSQQMERYMKAGINPLWAISNGDPGNAQQLTSASAHPAVGATMVAPTMQPEWDPNRLGNIVAAANNVNNSLQGFMKLGLEAMDVDTRKAVGTSQIGLNIAESAYKASQTAGQDIFNNLNQDTYSVLVGIKQREYDNLVEDLNNKKKNGQLTDAQIDNARESKNQIVAMTDYVRKQGDALIQQTRQGWFKLQIDQQNANTAGYVARSNSFYQGEDLKLRNKEFLFNKDKSIAEFKMQSNAQIVDWINEQRGAWEKISGATMKDGVNLNAEVLSRLEAAGEVLFQRLSENPSAENIKSFEEWNQATKSLPQAPMPTFDGANTSNTSIQNPLAPWNPWQ